MHDGIWHWVFNVVGRSFVGCIHVHIIGFLWIVVLLRMNHEYTIVYPASLVFIDVCMVILVHDFDNAGSLETSRIESFELERQVKIESNLSFQRGIY